MARTKRSTRATRVLEVIDHLSADLPPRAADKLRRRLVKLLASSYQTDHQPLPAWIEELKRRV